VWVAGREDMMGYKTECLIELADILRSAELTGKRVIDLGSQDVTLLDSGDVQRVREFVALLGGGRDWSVPSLRGSYPIVIAAREIFVAAGFDYTCCDVDRRPGTLYVDYNSLAFDRSLYGKFDLVLNAGTTEHLPNPAAAFFFMHYLCRKGGLLYNEVPLSGWFNHGLSNLTPKFWHTLRWMNSYCVLSAIVKKDETSDPGNFGGPHLDFIENLDELPQHSAILQIVFQKTEDRGFIPPYDAVVSTDDDGKALGDLVYSSLMPFVTCGSLTRKDAAASVNALLLLQHLSYRVKLSQAGDPPTCSRVTAWAVKAQMLLSRFRPRGVERGLSRGDRKDFPSGT
jgi:hypothetical protein